MFVPAASCLEHLLSAVCTLVLEVRRFVCGLFTVTLACVAATFLPLPDFPHLHQIIFACARVSELAQWKVGSSCEKLECSGAASSCRCTKRTHKISPVTLGNLRRDSTTEEMTTSCGASARNTGT